MRLYCTYIQQLPLFFPPQKEASPSLNCVLQCEPLANAQEVEVRLNGARLSGHLEEIYQIFAWQVKPQALMEVHLLHRGRPTKFWRGRWDGQQHLCHGGTLSLEVFLEQEVVAPSSSPPAALPSPHADVLASSNGHQADVAPVVSHPSHPSLPSVIFGDENLVVLAAGQPLASLPDVQIPFAFPASMVPDSPRQVPDDEEDLWTQAAETARRSPSEDESLDEAEVDGAGDEIWEEEEEPWTEDEGGEEEDLVEEEEEPDRSEEEVLGEEREAPLPAVLPVLSSVQIATFHAGIGVPFSSLLDLLGRMPPSTVVVDLRLHPKRRQGVATTTVFLKEQLRSTFGALYWDRGSLVQRTLHQTPQGAWETVITNPEDPSGVVALFSPLRRGTSLVFLDERAVYAESVRAAVIRYLCIQQQLPPLTIFPEA